MLFEEAERLAGRDRNDDRLRPDGLFTAGSTSSITCGLTARNSTLAFKSVRKRGHDGSRQPRRSSKASPSDGPGSTTMTAEPGTPLFSQPESMAPPIFPAPIRTTGCGEEKESSASHASPTVSNSTRFHRIRRIHAGPDDELECLEIGFAGVERAGKQHLDLAVGRLGAAGKQQRLAENDDIFLAPEVEMTHQHLAVDRREQLDHLVDPDVGNFDIEGAAEMQRLEFLHPGEGDVIVGPAALDRHRDLVLAGPFERPVVVGGDDTRSYRPGSTDARLPIPSGSCSTFLTGMNAT